VFVKTKEEEEKPKGESIDNEEERKQIPRKDAAAAKMGLGRRVGRTAQRRRLSGLFICARIALVARSPR